MRPEGALVAMATPFRNDGTIHRATLHRMVDFLIERGVDGIFAASTVGEFLCLSFGCPRSADGLIDSTQRSISTISEFSRRRSKRICLPSGDMSKLFNEEPGWSRVS